MHKPRALGEEEEKTDRRREMEEEGKAKKTRGRKKQRKTMEKREDHGLLTVGTSTGLFQRK